MLQDLEDEYNICVFAYNEERHIETSLRAIQTNVDKRLNKCFLIANGCTDNTVKIAKNYKSKENFESLEVVELELGDKCNAWNFYIHELSQPVGCHFMVDSDVEFTKNSFPYLFNLKRNISEKTNVLAGVPQSGRNLKFYRSLIEERSCFFGNLYGITPRFYSLIKKNKFYLPVGLNWIDSFLTKAANTDISFGEHNLPSRVTYDINIGFKFESLSPFSISDLKLYKNRIARYELGKIQEIYLDKMEVSQWPRNMIEINHDILKNLDDLTIHLNLIKKNLVKQRLKRLVFN